jgi:hypothetical protein
MNPINSTVSRTMNRTVNRTGKTMRTLTATFVLALGGLSLIPGGAVFAQTAAASPTASTQSRDLIASYRSIVKSLEAARASLANDPASSSAQIEAATTVFRNILDSVGSKQLEDGATRALKDSVLAVGRNSGTDLAAQVGQVESILQRVLYERLFVEMSGNNLPQAKRYASVLGEALKFSKDAQPKLLQSVAANNAARTRSLLETQISSSMSTALKSAKASPDKAVSFRQTALASSLFLIVQDSPRATELSSKDFSGSLSSLAAGNVPEFKQSIGSVISKVEGFNRRAKGLAATARPNVIAKPVKPVKPITAVKPALKPAIKPVKPVSSQVAKPVKPVKPVVSSKPVTSKPVTSKPVMTKPTAKPLATKPAISTPAIKPVAPIIDSGAAMASEMMRMNIPEKQARTFANTLAVQKFSSVKAATNQYQAWLARALTQVEVGDVNAGRTTLEEARTLYSTTIQPPYAVLDNDGANRTSGLLDATIAAPGVRPADVIVLLGDAQSLTSKLEGGEGPSGLHSIITAVQPIWMLLRGALFLIVGLAFFYPIYLLNLAFGGRNPFWRYIGIAMVLLFIPAILEGVSWLFSMLASLTGVQALGAIGAFSILQNPIAQIVWVLTLIATVVFSTLGFRGIAEQFGLLSAKTNNTVMNDTSFDTSFDTGFDTTMNTGLSTSVGSTSVRSTGFSTGSLRNTDVGGKTIVEWDEEF